MQSYYQRILIILSLVFFFLNSFGQSSSESFGKNRIQRRIFNWKYLTSPNFEVYYYDNNRELASYAIKQAEANFDRISNTIGFSPYTKIKLLVYSTISDLHQSNVGLQDDEVLIGGYTNFVKSRVEVAFRGTRAEFNRDINKGIANVIINVMMYGGSLKDVVQSSYLLALPDWFLEGASRYIAEGWSLEMDNYVRDLMLQKKLRKPTNMEGYEAYIVGHSIWNFIGKRYGEDNIANILNLTRIVRDEEESIENTLGMSYNTFIAEWEAYYKEMAKQVEQSHVSVDKSYRIKRSFTKNNAIRNIVMNNDGSRIAYSSHHRGRYKIIVTDSLHKKSRVIKRGGYKLIQQPENLNLPLLSWVNNKTLGYIFSRKGNTYLRLYNTSNRKKIKLQVSGVDEVIGIDFSDNARFVVMSAVKNGQSDIFIYDIERQSIRQVTNDGFDEIHPEFVDSTRAFLFSSNRDSDTLSKIRTVDITPQSRYNVFLYNADSSAKVLKRISQTGNNYHPKYSNGKIFYLSDDKGVLNLYQYQGDSVSSKQVTNYVRNINGYATDESVGKLVFTSQDKGRVNLYYIPFPDLDKERSGASTPRQVYFNNNKNKKSNEFIFKSEEGVSQDTEINVTEFEFESDKKKQKHKEKEKEVVKTDSKKQDVLGPYNARNLFSVDKIVSTVQVDPLRGLGMFVEGGMSDMMGNHKMNAGLFQVIDLRSNDIYGEYLYLRSRVDFKARFERQTYSLASETGIHKYTNNKVSLTASYPFSVFDRISITPFVQQTRFSNTYSINTPDVTRLYTGFRAEYVFDNTEVTGMNMIKGTKLKVGAEQYYHQGRFGKITFDLRHYQPLHKEIVFATRLSFGSFMGPSPKSFLLGGMDNWLFNSTYHMHGNQDPLRIDGDIDNSDILFARYITSLRGFQYNTIFGSKYILYNAELRIPLIRYLYNGTITSNFFRNLQITGFTDIGTAWSGNNPFNKDNNLNKRVIIDGNGALVSTVINYKNPFLVGYGFGARTLFLGYYVKFDVAWGIINYERQEPKYYLTLGYDF